MATPLFALRQSPPHFPLGSTGRNLKYVSKVPPTCTQVPLSTCQHHKSPLLR